MPAVQHWRTTGRAPACPAATKHARKARKRWKQQTALHREIEKEAECRRHLLFNCLVEMARSINPNQASREVGSNEIRTITKNKTNKELQDQILAEASKQTKLNIKNHFCAINFSFEFSFNPQTNSLKRDLIIILFRCHLLSIDFFQKKPPRTSKSKIFSFFSIYLKKKCLHMKNG